MGIESDGAAFLLLSYPAKIATLMMIMMHLSTSFALLLDITAVSYEIYSLQLHSPSPF